MCRRKRCSMEGVLIHLLYRRRPLPNCCKLLYGYACHCLLVQYESFRPIADEAIGTAWRVGFRQYRRNHRDVLFLSTDVRSLPGLQYWYCVHLPEWYSCIAYALCIIRENRRCSKEPQSGSMTEDRTGRSWSKLMTHNCF